MRNLTRMFKGAGILNIFGMTAAFAAIYIILVQVNYDWNYNSKIKDLDRIFIVTHKDWHEEGKYSSNLCRPLGEPLIGEASMVESYAIVEQSLKKSINIGNGNNRNLYELNTMSVTSGAFDVFGFEAEVGSFDGIGEEFLVAISEKTARKFNLKVGDVIKFDNEKEQRIISAIYKNMPLNSMFGNVDLLYSNILETEAIDVYSEWSYKYYIKLNSKNSKSEFEKSTLNKAWDLVKSNHGDNFWKNEKEENIKDRYAIKLFPLKGLQFRKEISDNITIYQCNRATTITLFVVAILILSITMINYLNFFMAQIPSKLRSVNTKKILGSYRLQLVLDFIIESTALVIISLLLSYVVLCIIMSSTYAELISCSLEVNHNIAIAAITVILAIVVTIISVVYPAVYVTSFSPALAIKGTLGTVSKGKTFRYILVGFQFTISIIFILCAFFMKLQYDYMMNYNMGFDKESLFTVDVHIDTNKKDLFTEEIQNKTAIKEVAWAASPIVSKYGMNWGIDLDGKEIYFTSYPVSYNFLKFMGIKIFEGSDFTLSDEKRENGKYIFNRRAKEKFNIRLDSKIPGHNSEIADIAGFCENFKFKPLHYEVEPFAFYIFGKNPWWQPSHLYIRSNPGATYNDVLNAVKEVVADVTPAYNPEEIELKYFDDELGVQYKKEQKLISLITLFTLLAIIISLIGIIGLLMFETKFRRKEIGLRRVHGASINEILELFNRKFFYILLVSFLIAAPVGYAVMDYYYSTFAYRSPLYWWVFLLAFVIVAAVTAGVVTLCSYRAASENPAETLKNE